MQAAKVMSMKPPQPKSTDDLLDLLMDLQHDLGKYIRMPLGFLPANASDEEIHKALSKALLNTRDTPKGVVSARDLWNRFLVEVDGTLDAQPLFEDLERAVETALAWEQHAKAPAAPLERPALEADLAAVTPAIRALINHLQS